MGDWLEQERTWFSLRRELTRLKRRATSRWLIVIGVTGLLTVGALYKLSRPPGIFTARVILRVAETNLLRDQSPLVGRGLEDYLLEAALRTDGIIELLERNDMYKRARSLGDTYAANKFRNALNVAVYRNYFAVGRGYNEGVRTARISIRYRSSDPEKAMTVVREVADLMAKTEGENRRRASLKLAAIGRIAASGAEARLEQLELRLFEAERKLADFEADKNSVAAAPIRVEVNGLRAAVLRQSERLEKAQQQLQLIELREAVVDNQLGVSFRVVSEQPPARRAGLGGPLLLMVGLTLFILLLPLSAIGVGAFDVRVHDGDDVERLGLPVLGRLADDEAGPDGGRVT